MKYFIGNLNTWNYSITIKFKFYRIQVANKNLGIQK